MSRAQPLQGGCFCGRNSYIIRIPEDAKEIPRVFFDSGHRHRHSQATPLSAWIRVPLSWYQSTTQSFMPDETHASIRRTYTSPFEQHAKRNFCGYCGTQLSFWCESPPSEADYISLTLGSLDGKDLRELEDLGLLPREAVDDAEYDKDTVENVIPYQASDLLSGSNGSLPWFETLVHGSRLGNMKRSWGQGQSGNGKVKIEWEIVEWNDDGTEGETLKPAKRKLDEVVEDESVMEGVL